MKKHDLSAIMWHKGDGTGVPGVTNKGVVLCFLTCLSEKGASEVVRNARFIGRGGHTAE